jgi:hypothetical protein
MAIKPHNQSIWLPVISEMVISETNRHIARQTQFKLLLDSFP